MKQILILVLSLLSLSNWARTIEVHYALEEDDPFLGILRRSQFVRAEMDSLSAMARSRGLRVMTKIGSTQNDFLNSIGDSQTVGLVWIGHSKPAVDNEVTYNAFMMDARDQYVTKSIGAAASEALEFLAINTCFAGHINPLYSWHNQRYDVITHDFEVDENNLNQLTNVVQGTIEILRQATAKIRDMNTTTEFNISEKKTLEISYRDLLSTQFGYDVLLNNRLIGLLDKEELRDFRGKTKTFQVPAELLKRSNLITIRPTDPDRTSPKYAHPIDNIIVSKIKIDGRVIFDQEINLGDEDLDDSEIGLSKVINRTTLQRLPYQPELNMEF